MKSEINIEDFDYIWDQWVKDAVEKIQKQMDEEFKKHVNFKTRNLSLLKSQACDFFFEKRDEIKDEYYGIQNKEPLAPHLMDFHKLSAILCRTLIEYKVYEFDVQRCEEYIRDMNICNKDTNWLVHNALVNFRLAFYCSIIFLYKSMLYALHKYDKDLYDSLLGVKKLNLYTSFNEGSFNNTSHESFENSLVLNLAKRDIDNRSFDYFLYATIMYQLEKYNIMLLKQNKNDTSLL